MSALTCICNDRSVVPLSSMAGSKAALQDCGVAFEFVDSNTKSVPDFEHMPIVGHRRGGGINCQSNSRGERIVAACADRRRARDALCGIGGERLNNVRRV